MNGEWEQDFFDFTANAGRVKLVVEGELDLGNDLGFSATLLELDGEQWRERGEGWGETLGLAMQDLFKKIDK